MANRRFKDFIEGIPGAALIAGCVLLRPLMRPWYSRWNATDEEVNRSLPGREFVPHPKGGYTQAITIPAPTEEVWPWVVQIGQGRGGFYSYDFLENLVGCDIHSVERIVPQFQNFEPGEGLRLFPEAPLFHWLSLSRAAPWSSPEETKRRPVIHGGSTWRKSMKAPPDSLPGGISTTGIPWEPGYSLADLWNQ